jgi:hypothetical protein
MHRVRSFTSEILNLKPSQFHPTGRTFPTLLKAFSSTQNLPQGSCFPKNFTAGSYTEPQGLGMRDGAGSVVREVLYGDRKAFIKPVIVRESETSIDQTAGREVFASAFGRHIVGASIPVNMVIEKSGEDIQSPRCISIAPSKDPLIPFSDFSRIYEFPDAANLRKSMPDAFHELGSNLAFNILLATGDRHDDQLLFSRTNRKWYEIDFAQSFNTQSPHTIGDPSIPYGIATLGQSYQPDILREINRKPTFFLQAVEKIKNSSDAEIEEALAKIPVTHLSQENKVASFNFVQYRRDHFLEISRDFLEKHQMEHCLQGLLSCSRSTAVDIRDDTVIQVDPPISGSSHHDPCGTLVGSVRGR